ncbi:hypothetical protein [Methanococcus maripaludis]|uniref:Uncharacterized protein n=1 Tax=Methanococcus maripaludis TaxID=39152 RepID=A0A7J9PHF9_METMI|nr:hypothetical protein [Methanococcus maripaludis]MBA2860959.1 hypothetical protein [Methanococcus maripaludis]
MEEYELATISQEELCKIGFDLSAFLDRLCEECPEREMSTHGRDIEEIFKPIEQNEEEKNGIERDIGIAIAGVLRERGIDIGYDLYE